MLQKRVGKIVYSIGIGHPNFLFSLSNISASACILSLFSVVIRSEHFLGASCVCAINISRFMHGDGQCYFILFCSFISVNGFHPMVGPIDAISPFLLWK